MKKTVVMALLALSVGSLAACDQKVNQVVNIDKSLLESLAGRTGDKSDTTTPRPTSKPAPSPSKDPEPDTVSVDVPSGDEAALYQVIRDNASALNSQSIEAYTKTLHPDSKFSASMPDLFYYLVQAQTRYELHDMEVDEINGNDATVYVDRTATDLGGPLRLDIIYSLRKSGGAWKVFYMDVDDSGEFVSDDDF